MLNRGISPTGSTLEQFNIHDVGNTDISVINVANLSLFVCAADVVLDHEEALAALETDKNVVSRPETIRAPVSA